MKFDVTVDLNAMMALYLVRALTSQNVMTTDQAAQVLATTAGWLEQIENEFPEAYRGTRELATISGRAKAYASTLREQGLQIAYGAPLTFHGVGK